MTNQEVAQKIVCGHIAYGIRATGTDLANLERAITTALDAKDATLRRQLALAVAEIRAWRKAEATEEWSGMCAVRAATDADPALAAMVERGGV